METTLDIPEELLEEARERLGFKSKTETVILSLQELVRRKRLEEVKSQPDHGHRLEAVEPAALRSLFDLLQRAARLDEDFASDLEEIQAAQPAIGEGPWHS